jgi:hypothetical protein
MGNKHPYLTQPRLINDSLYDSRAPEDKDVCSLLSAKTLSAAGVRTPRWLLTLCCERRHQHEPAIGRLTELVWKRHFWAGLGDGAQVMDKNRLDMLNAWVAGYPGWRVKGGASAHWAQKSAVRGRFARTSMPLLDWPIRANSTDGVTCGDQSVIKQTHFVPAHLPPARGILSG